MAALDYSRPLTPSGNLGRRKVIDRIMRSGATLAAFIAVAILVLVIYTIVQRGAGAISLTFLTKNPSEEFGAAAAASGGIFNAIIGSGLIVALATVIALPIGLLIAVFLTEFATPRAAAPVRLALDLLYGLPSIVIALFFYGLLVVGHGQTGLCASLALAVIMLPLIARTTSESLLLVPKELRDASHALGISRWRTTIGMTIPSALGGIVTGTVLAVARAAGETAPMLLLSSLFNPSSTTLSIFGEPLPNIPIDIFNFSEAGGSANLAKAWGAALVLVAFVLIANFAARALHARSRKMMTAR